MSIVKISNKEALEKLQANFTLRLGRKLTQQETLDICIKSGLDNTDILLQYIEDTPIVNKEKITAILKARDELANIPYDIESNELSEDDKDIYS